MYIVDGNIKGEYDLSDCSTQMRALELTARNLVDIVVGNVDNAEPAHEILTAPHRFPARFTQEKSNPPIQQALNNERKNQL